MPSVGDQPTEAQPGRRGLGCGARKREIPVVENVLQGTLTFLTVPDCLRSTPVSGRAAQCRVTYR